MPHCTQCGTMMEGQVAFCPKCGAAQGAAPAGGGGNVTQQSGLAENVAGALSYSLGWLTGIIFLLIDKRPTVRFHAAQSIVVFGGLHVITIVLAMIWGGSFWMGGWGAFTGFGMIFMLIRLGGFVLWILLMVKAAQGQKWELPVAADIAKGIAGK